MPTTQTNLPDVPQGVARQVSAALLKWLNSVSAQLPLREVDTSAGPYAEDTPPAGFNLSTGQWSGQNQEIIYKKLSADANVFTLNGTAEGPLPEGPLHLNAQYDYLRIKSDGSSWYVVT